MANSNELSIKIKINADTKALEIVQTGFDGVAEGAQKAGKSADDFSKKLMDFAHFGEGVASVTRYFDMLKTAITETVGSAIKLSGELEAIKIGTSAVLINSSQNISALGQELDARQKIILAQKESNELIKLARVTATEAGLNVADFTRTLQVGLSDAKKLGVSDADYVKITQAVTKAATLEGLNPYTVPMEMRQMLEGITDPRQAPINAMYGHVTQSDLVQWQIEGNVGEKLKERLSGVLAMQDDFAKSWKGISAQIENNLANLKIEATSSFFEELKKQGYDFNELLKNNHTEIVAFFKSAGDGAAIFLDTSSKIISAITPIASTLSSAFMPLAEGGAIFLGMRGLSNLILGLPTLIEGVSVALMALAAKNPYLTAIAVFSTVGIEALHYVDKKNELKPATPDAIKTWRADGEGAGGADSLKTKLSPFPAEEMMKILAKNAEVSGNTKELANIKKYEELTSLKKAGVDISKEQMTQFEGLAKKYNPANANRENLINSALSNAQLDATEKGYKQASALLAEQNKLKEAMFSSFTQIANASLKSVSELNPALKNYAEYRQKLISIDDEAAKKQLELNALRQKGTTTAFEAAQNGAKIKTLNAEIGFLPLKKDAAYSEYSSKTAEEYSKNFASFEKGLDEIAKKQNETILKSKADSVDKKSPLVGLALQHQATIQKIADDTQATYEKAAKAMNDALISASSLTDVSKIQEAYKQINDDAIKVFKTIDDAQSALIDKAEKETQDKANKIQLAWLDTLTADMGKALDANIFNALTGKFTEFKDWWKNLWSSLGTSALQALARTMSGGLVDIVSGSLKSAFAQSFTFSASPSFVTTAGALGSAIPAMANGGGISSMADFINYATANPNLDPTMLSQAYSLASGGDFSGSSSVLGLGGGGSSSGLLGQLSNIKSVYDMVTGGIGNTITGAFATGAQYISALSPTLGANVAMFGQGMAMNTASESLAAYGGAGIAGGLGGYALGSLGDYLTGTKTQAANYGAIGGSIGAIGGSFIPGIGTAIGAVAGAALGSVIGGMFGGGSEVTSQGVNISGGGGAVSGNNYTNTHKDGGWFDGGSNSTSTQGLSWAQTAGAITALMAFSQVASNLDLKAPISASGQYASVQAFSDQGLATSLLNAATGNTAPGQPTYYQAWADYAKANNTSVSQSMLTSFGAMGTQSQQNSAFLAGGNYDANSANLKVLEQNFQAISQWGSSPTTTAGWQALKDTVLSSQPSPQTINAFNALGAAILANDQALKTATQNLTAATAQANVTLNGGTYNPNTQALSLAQTTFSADTNNQFSAPQTLQSWQALKDVVMSSSPSAQIITDFTNLGNVLNSMQSSLSAAIRALAPTSLKVANAGVGNFGSSMDGVTAASAQFALDYGKPAPTSLAAWQALQQIVQDTANPQIIADFNALGQSLISISSAVNSAQISLNTLNAQVNAFANNSTFNAPAQSLKTAQDAFSALVGTPAPSTIREWQDLQTVLLKSSPTPDILNSFNALGSAILSVATAAQNATDAVMGQINTIAGLSNQAVINGQSVTLPDIGVGLQLSQYLSKNADFFSQNQALMQAIVAYNDNKAKQDLSIAEQNISTLQRIIKSIDDLKSFQQDLYTNPDTSPMSPKQIMAISAVQMQNAAFGAKTAYSAGNVTDFNTQISALQSAVSEYLKEAKATAPSAADYAKSFNLAQGMLSQFTDKSFADPVQTQLVSLTEITQALQTALNQTSLNIWDSINKVKSDTANLVLSGSSLYNAQVAVQSAIASGNLTQTQLLGLQTELNKAGISTANNTYSLNNAINSMQTVLNTGSIANASSISSAITAMQVALANGGTVNSAVLSSAILAMQNDLKTATGTSAITIQNALTTMQTVLNNAGAVNATSINSAILGMQNLLNSSGAVNTGAMTTAMSNLQSALGAITTAGSVSVSDSVKNNIATVQTAIAAGNLTLAQQVGLQSALNTINTSGNTNLQTAITNVRQDLATGNTTKLAQDLINLNTQIATAQITNTNTKSIADTNQNNSGYLSSVSTSVSGLLAAANKTPTANAVDPSTAKIADYSYQTWQTNQTIFTMLNTINNTTAWAANTVVSDLLVPLNNINYTDTQSWGILSRIVGVTDNLPHYLNAINGNLMGIPKGAGASNYGFAHGGYTGDGGVFDVAGVVHKGEYVLPQTMSYLFPTMEKIRLNGGIKSYANGGAVGGYVALTSKQDSPKELEKIMRNTEKMAREIEKLGRIFARVDDNDALLVRNAA